MQAQSIVLPFDPLVSLGVGTRCIRSPTFNVERVSESVFYALCMKESKSLVMYLEGETSIGCFCDLGEADITGFSFIFTIHYKHNESYPSYDTIT